MADNLDQILTQQGLHIAAHGWAVTAVLPAPGDAPYSYTAGLTAIGAPELVISGLRHEIAHVLLNDAAQRVHDQEMTWCHRQRIADLLAGYDAVIIDGVAHDLLNPGTAHARYGSDQVRLQQIVWPDPDGQFPWEPGYRYPTTVQPLLNPATT